ncbi:hypothetical protein V494_05884 [Pseudogymnoascus sp. VKM F-4513 (FW-928)]|nr:hypothetical protein V494_05884 [Pseudogymnoascus sp. VKM F-4513 (FW-928)]
MSNQEQHQGAHSYDFLFHEEETYPSSSNNPSAYDQGNLPFQREGTYPSISSNPSAYDERTRPAGSMDAHSYNHPFHGEGTYPSSSSNPSAYDEGTLPAGSMGAHSYKQPFHGEGTYPSSSSNTSAYYEGTRLAGTMGPRVHGERSQPAGLMTSYFYGEQLHSTSSDSSPVFSERAPAASATPSATPSTAPSTTPAATPSTAPSTTPAATPSATPSRGPKTIYSHLALVNDGTLPSLEYLEQCFAKFARRNAIVYLDDIMVFSETPEQHFADLRSVVDLLTLLGVRADETRCGNPRGTERLVVQHRVMGAEEWDNGVDGITGG